MDVIGSIGTRLKIYFLTANGLQFSIFLSIFTSLYLWYVTFVSVRNNFKSMNPDYKVLTNAKESNLHAPLIQNRKLYCVFV